MESEPANGAIFAMMMVRCPARTRLLVGVCLLHGPLNRLQRVLICAATDQEALIQLFHPDAQQNNHLSLSLVCGAWF